MDKAAWHERALHWHNRPLAALLMKGVTLWGRGVYVPGVGYVVNDPDVAVQLLNHEAFRSKGPGSMDEVITGLVGRDALLNMDGPSPPGDAQPHYGRVLTAQCCRACR